MNILILKSAGSFFQEVQNKIEENYPDANLHILQTSDPRQKQQIEDTSDEDLSVWNLNTDRFSLKGNEDKLKAIGENQYERVYILYRDHPSNYMNLINFVSDIPYSDLYFINGDLEETKFQGFQKFSTLIKSRLGDLLGWIKDGLTLTVVIFMVIITYIISLPIKAYRLIRK